MCGAACGKVSQTGMCETKLFIAYVYRFAFFVNSTKVVSTSLVGPLRLHCLLTVTMKRKA